RELLPHFPVHGVSIRKVIVAPAIRAVADHGAAVNEQVADGDVPRVRQPPRPHQVRRDRLVESHPPRFDLLHHERCGHRLGDGRTPVAGRLRCGTAPGRHVRSALRVQQDHARVMADPRCDSRIVPQHRLIANPAAGDLGRIGELARCDFQAARLLRFGGALLSGPARRGPGDAARPGRYDDADVVDDLLLRLLSARSAVIADVSSDGAELLVRCDDSGSPQVYRLPAAGGDLIQVTFLDEPVSAARYIPGTDDLVVAVDRGGNENYQLWLVDLNGGEPRALIVEENVKHDLGDVSRDGRLIAFCSTKRNGVDIDVHVLDRIEGTTRSVLEGGWNR